jgi:hypothetical protein
MTAKTDEHEKPPFETQGEPFDSSRASQGKQGPATSFVVAWAFAQVAGALGYKRTDPSRLEWFPKMTFARVTPFQSGRSEWGRGPAERRSRSPAGTSGWR